MSEGIRKLGWGIQWSAMAALLVTLLAVCAGQPVDAPDPAATPTPHAADDCWGGVLSESPLHCYVLEQAQADGAIHVEAMYVSPQGTLHVFLGQTELLDTALRDVLVDKTYQFLDTPQGRELQGDGGWGCLGLEGREWQDCIVSSTKWGDMAWFDRRVQRMVPPWPGEYANMLLHAGGADGRKTVGGWASWSQAWPAVAAGASDDSGGFDVSDVDTDVTSIPDPDCETVYPGPSRTMGLSCMLWARVPDAGVAGSHVDRSKSPSAVYVQLKASIPEGEAELEALKQKLFPDYRDDIDEVVLIPVKYDFGELWRWAEILDRFSLSAANTIGIEGASVHRNAKANSGTVTLFPVDGLRPAEWEDKAAWRNTILVGALDGHRVVEALPELLPLLGIPVDAVGRVVQVSERPITSEAQPW